MDFCVRMISAPLNLVILTSDGVLMPPILIICVVLHVKINMPCLNLFTSLKQIGILVCIVSSVAFSPGDIRLNVTAELPVGKVLGLLSPSVGLLGPVTCISPSDCTDCILFVSTGGGQRLS